MGYSPPPPPRGGFITPARYDPLRGSLVCDYCERQWRYGQSQCKNCGAKDYEQKTDKRPKPLEPTTVMR